MTATAGAAALSPTFLFMIYIAPSRKTTAGFTLLEVMVSIALTGTFVSVALQGMGVATILQTRAIQSAEAANWIQTDLEILRIQTASSQLPFNSNYCHAQQADRGYAQALSTRLTSIPSSSLRHSRTGQKFVLDRRFSVEPSAPFNVLGISYLVTPENSSKSILNFYTEVIPDEAFTCE
jgi:prepilin-type N-terminal cleavage/methylation domain-containing protein